ncbi:MAG: class I SAM-dependent methyltransferase [Caldilineaceae bacterium]
MGSEQATLLPLLYESEERYGWSVGMRAITHALMMRVPLPDGPILELGCGGGAFLRELSQRQNGRQVLGADLHPTALISAQRRLNGRSGPVGANMLTLPFAAATFGAVVALDSFDQQGVKLSLALAESHRVLRPRGLLLLRVSAYEWLHSTHDTAFNTGRRYTRKELQTVLAYQGFQPLTTTYANAIMLPPVTLIRLLQRYKLAPFVASQYNTSRFDELMKAILKLEAHWIERWNMPFGISLYVAAQKVEV